MEEKKFPWLLRLLSVNSCNIQLLETYAIDKSKVVSSFINDFHYKLIQTNGKNLPFNTVHKCLDYISSQQSFISPSHQVRHTFFRYKGKVTEVPQSLLNSYQKKTKPTPMISYIQVARSPMFKFVNFVVELKKNSLRGNMFPSPNNPSVLEEAKEISRVIISLIERHEGKKVAKISFEFLVHKSLKLSLSYLSCCLLSPRDRQSLSSKASIRLSNALEISEILNELSSPSKILQRKPSIIKQVVEEETSIIEISESSVESSADSLEESQSGESYKDDGHDLCLKPAGHDNFIELICGTRIQQRLGKKMFLSDDDLESEKNSVFEIIEEATKVRSREKEIFQRNSVLHRKYNSKPSILNLLPSESLRTPVSKRLTSLDSLPIIVSRKRNTCFPMTSSNARGTVSYF